MSRRNQAHPDPSIRPRFAPRSAGSYIGRGPVKPGPVKAREPRLERLDKFAALVIVFIAAVYFTAHVLVSSGLAGVACP